MIKNIFLMFWIGDEFSIKCSPVQIVNLICHINCRTTDGMVLGNNAWYRLCSIPINFGEEH